MLRFLAATILATASTLSFALNVPLGTMDNRTVVIGNGVVEIPFFFDTYSFTLTVLSDLSGSTSSVDITGFTAVLQDSTFAAIGVDNNPNDGFSFADVGPGNYFLNFVGAAQTGGAYEGDFTARSDGFAVPESESYALVLAALGLITAQRRVLRRPPGQLPHF